MASDSPPLAADAAAAAFAALGSAPRLAVLRALVRAAPGGLAIGALGARCGLAGATLTHHVAALVRAGLVRRSRQGRSAICRADTAAIRALSDFLLAECCADCAPPGPAATLETADG